jgi:hypothetical protein
MVLGLDHVTRRARGDTEQEVSKTKPLALFLGDWLFSQIFGTTEKLLEGVFWTRQRNTRRNQILKIICATREKLWSFQKDRTSQETK